MPDRPVARWVSSVSLEGLMSPVAEGGLGLDLGDLELEEAWVFDRQARLLEAWARSLREARAAAVEAGDAPMKRLVGAAYKSYIGRMVNPDLWGAKTMRHHHQPLWRAAIMAHCRWRGRRVAMRIAGETGRWPIRTLTDSWVYLLPDGVDIADESAALGKMVVEKDARLTAADTAAFAEAQTNHDVALAISGVYRKG
jgi:hypothetical protein